MTKYQNKYRIESIRLPNYDYSQPGAYFITICTHNKIHYFGEITNGKMRLNNYGKIVEEEWLKTPMIRPDMNLILDEYIIMPNHFHSIIIINENEINTRRDAMHCVSTNCVSTNQFGRQSKNLGSIVRGFKSACTKQINTLRHATIPPIWQRNYYEHIIRNEKSLSEIRNYIQNNPLNWEHDEYYIH